MSHLLGNSEMHSQDSGQPWYAPLNTYTELTMMGHWEWTNFKRG
jgi:hypothetical protein